MSEPSGKRQKAKDQAIPMSLPQETAACLERSQECTVANAFLKGFSDVITMCPDGMVHGCNVSPDVRSLDSLSLEEVTAEIECKPSI